MPLNLTVFNQFYAINKICGQEKQRHCLRGCRDRKMVDFHSRQKGCDELQGFLLL